jgi:EpsI family protein
VVNSVTQLAMVSMVPLAVWVVLGTRVLRVLAFPLAFLFFAVPLGEFMIPQLIDWTARFTVFALRASGVPVLVEGNLLTVPTGSWAIVEACSGIRYLIASVMIGFLFAYLSYRSTRRRLVFIGASVVVPIVANWLRAYLIVLLGHLTNNRLAAGVDHIIYGWIFFGIVMGLLFWIGGKWREDEPLAEAPALRERDRPARPAGVRPSVALLAVAAVIVAFPVLAHVVWRTGAQSDAATLDAVAGANGWSADTRAFTTWRPEIEGASAELTQGFVKNGARVGVHVAFFPRTTPASKAITTANVLVHPGNPIWRQTDSRTLRATIDGASVTAPLDTIARPSESLAVTRWFWVDGRIATREIVAKLLQLAPALRGRPDSVAWVVVYAPAEPGKDAAPLLESFVRDMSPAIDAVVARAAGAH